VTAADTGRAGSDEGAMKAPGERPRAHATTDATADAGAIEVISRFEGRAAPIRGGPVEEWLLGAGRELGSADALFDELCWRLVGAGIPLWRATISLATLHPQALSYGYRWWRQRGMTEEVSVRHNIVETDDYLASPIRRVIEHGEVARFSLEDEAVIETFPLLRDFRRAGGTDYFASPLSSFNGRHQASTWTTDRPGGFSGPDLDRIRGLLPILSIIAEGIAMRRLAGTLLDTYLGPTIGQRILQGEVRRGHGERLRAVLMAIDLRGFTSLSDRLPPETLIALLDSYFETAASAIASHGGEILKFVGDGVLAIFQAASAAQERAMAAAALAAGEDLLTRLAKKNLKREAAGVPAIRIGIGIHLGEVFYGNVGAAQRLDFTAIGPAVNLACRLESLTKRFGRPLLLSQDIARLLDRPLLSLGFQPVKGLGEPEEVFAPADGPATGVFE
jgi:adenylate cyclase